MGLEVDKKMLLDFYHKGLTTYGKDIKTLGYGSVESQESRLRVISEIGDLNNKSILDVGCGFGDLYTFLHKQGIHPKRYLGIDINSELLDVARERLPGVEFELAAILDFEPIENFDFVVACGIFGLETPHWQRLLEEQLRKLFDLCKIGIAVNFLSYYTTWGKAANSHYARPEDTLKFVLNNLSKQVVLRHDYIPNDFTIYMYKQGE
jgi:SAM-dependent methyltransferase